MDENSPLIEEFRESHRRWKAARERLQKEAQSLSDSMKSEDQLRVNLLKEESLGAGVMKKVSAMRITAAAHDRVSKAMYELAETIEETSAIASKIEKESRQDG